MAVTKLGAELMTLEKRALFGFKKKQSSPTPSLWQRVGHGMGRVSSFAMPGLMTFGAVNSIASGENSVGGGLGGLGGELAGWSLGSRAVGALTKNMKPGRLKGILGFAGGMIAAGPGSTIGESLGFCISRALVSRKKNKKTSPSAVMYSASLYVCHDEIRAFVSYQLDGVLRLKPSQSFRKPARPFSHLTLLHPG